MQKNTKLYEGSVVRLRKSCMDKSVCEKVGADEANVSRDKACRKRPFLSNFKIIFSCLICPSMSELQNKS